jgi:hypothetical protein
VVAVVVVVVMMMMGGGVWCGGDGIWHRAKEARGNHTRLRGDSRSAIQSVFALQRQFIPNAAAKSTKEENQHHMLSTVGLKSSMAVQTLCSSVEMLWRARQLAPCNDNRDDDPSNALQKNTLKNE